MAKIIDVGSSLQAANSKDLLDFQSELQTKECNLCHYSPWLRDNYFFPVASSGTGRILVVGPQVFLEEHKSNMACGGAFRKVFVNYLQKFTGLAESDCTFTYAVKCTGDEESDKAKTLEFRNCSRYLMKEIKTIDPVVIVFLGKDASKSLLDNKTRQAHNMGSAFKSFIMGKPRWCYFITNPMIALVQSAAVPSVEAHFKGLSTFLEDKTNIYETVQKPEKSVVKSIDGRKYILVDTEEKLKDMMSYFSDKKYIGMDTETNSLYTWSSTFKVVGISLAADDTTGYYIPFGHKSKGRKQYKQLSWDVVKPYMEQLCYDPNKQTIWHNLYYDYCAMKRMGIDVFKLDPERNIWTHDSMVMTYLHNENPTIGLKDQMYSHFGIQPLKFKGVLADSDVNTFEDVSPEDALQYAADDAINCLMLFKKVSKLVKHESDEYTDGKLLSKIYPDELNTIKVIADAHLRGVRIDNDYLQDLQSAVKEDLQQTQSAIYELSTAVSNFSSNPRIVELLEGLLTKSFIDRFNKKFVQLNAQEKTLKILCSGYSKYWEFYEQGLIDHMTGKPFDKPGKWEPSKLQNYLELITRYRRLLKVKSTYIETNEELKQLDENGDWVIHANIRTIGTTSGRMSSNNPNLQNIPAAVPKSPSACSACGEVFRDDTGNIEGACKKDSTLSRYTCSRCGHVNKTYVYDLRRLYIPRKGYKFIGADYVGMELYLAAAVSGCQELYDVFLKKEKDSDDPNGDMHVVTASSILGITPDTWKDWKDNGSSEQKATAKNTRKIAKTVNYLTLYGGSAEGLQRSLLAVGIDKTKQECEDYINAFFEAYPALKKWFEDQKFNIQNYGRLVNAYGRIRHVLKKGTEALSAINMLIQGLGAQIIKESLVNMDRAWKGKDWHTLLVIHDENVVEVPEEDLKEASESIINIMEISVKDKITVDLLVDGDYGKNSLSKADKGIEL
tara:strand:+ start:1603 stop:4455 length:2853 start_codon:yes stop_codon:yes gene_type:complete